MHLQCQIYNLLVVELTSSIKVTINHSITTTSNCHLPALSSQRRQGLHCRQSQASIIPHLLEFVNNSCTPFHATAEARRHLLDAGFQQLSECDEWALQPGGHYFFIRNMSSIFAFAIGHKYKPGNGFHVVAAHTDSPCPKLTPVSHSSKGCFLHVQVKTCGSGMWHTWFDRDLSVAGRVLLRRKDGELVHELVRVRRPILRIPSLRKLSERGLATEDGKAEMDAQFAPILAIQIESELTVPYDSESSMPVERPECIGHLYPQNRTPHHPLLIQVLAEELNCDVMEIADFELNVYDTQPGCVGGAREEFVFASRLDNLASSFCALWALLDTCREPSSLLDESGIHMVALFDIGEQGSDSVQGAGPQIMLQAMTRITRWLAQGKKTEGVVERAVRRSFIVAADMAPAMHPTQMCGMSQDDAFRQPKLFDGLVIKQDAVHSNTTNIVTSFLFREVAKRNCIPIQSFTVLRDMGCCSTANPIFAAGYGIQIVDCGLPQLSMHSVREMCGAEDINTAFRHFRAFFQEFTSIDEQFRMDM
ncbi:hypothetical protein BDL97_17G005600 [Sphagnum fallax]|nr:hypothetical protein BDL97_17G005600 [Sphagnum fallax]